MALNTFHFTAYSLKKALFKEGKLDLVDDELDREMYHRAIERLKGAGYHHYEISNASKIGYECKHNLKYWSMDDYIGIGLGAHSFVQNKRYSNETNMKRYIEKVKQGYSPVIWTHENNIKDDMSEYVFTGMRKTSGISLAEFKERFDRELFEVYEAQKDILIGYMNKGYIKIEEDCVKLTEKGIDISNMILSEFV